MENQEAEQRTHRPMKTPLQIFCPHVLQRKYTENIFVEEKVCIKLKLLFRTYFSN